MENVSVATIHCPQEHQAALPQLFGYFINHFYTSFLFSLPFPLPAHFFFPLVLMHFPSFVRQWLVFSFCFQFFVRVWFQFFCLSLSLVWACVRVFGGREGVRWGSGEGMACVPMFGFYPLFWVSVFRESRFSVLVCQIFCFLTRKFDGWTLFFSYSFFFFYLVPSICNLWINMSHLSFMLSFFFPSFGFRISIIRRSVMFLFSYFSAVFQFTNLHFLHSCGKT